MVYIRFQQTVETKKGHQKFLALKSTFFPKKVIRKFGPQIFFPSPQTRHQVSVYVWHGP